MRAALYVRVSTEDQAIDGFSLEAQMRKLEAYCAAENYDIADRYIDDGYSGTKTARPEYQRMLKDIDKWDVIVVLKMDRIHRNSVNFTQMMDLLRKRNKNFASVYDQFDTVSAMGRFVMDIMQRIAQLESEQIGERVKLAMKYKAENGSGNLGSAHPYGYEYKDGNLVVIDDEAHIVRAIFNMYTRGSTLQDICDYLNSAGIESKKGVGWSRQTISNILHNPIYIGQREWDGIRLSTKTEAIVSVEKFKAINPEYSVS
ncbi:MAG: recombinase family protein [Thermoplasmata archaeon]|nr:recombinase family protein [Thermoplasmata archaeon]